MHYNLKKIKNYILELIFPVYCVACGKDEFWLCPKCLEKIDIKIKLVCPLCQQENKQGRVCPSCRAKSSLNQLVVVADYQDKTIQNIIHLLKYNFAYEIRSAFADILDKFFRINPLKLPAACLIIPIPLHKKRRRFRGFNQAQIIGEELAKIFSLPIIIDNLQRIKYTQPQVELAAKERKNNIIGAFSLNNPLEISGKSVILIDDVYTTGSTMNEAGKVLKKAGAKEVIGFVIARG